MLFIFNDDEALLSILENKEGVANYYDAVHIEELNGKNNFIFKIIADHPDADDVAEGNLVGFHDVDANFQLFEIKIVEEIRTNRLEKNVFAEHISYELLDEIIVFKREYNITPFNALVLALDGTRWDAGVVDATDELSRVQFRLETVKRAIDRLRNRAGVQADFKFRMEFSNGEITDRFVDLLDERGQDTGKRFVYGKDLVDVNRTIDIEGLKTALVPFGKSQETPLGYQRVRIKDIEWSIGAGDPLDKPLGQEYLGDPDALSKWGRAGGTRHRFGIFDDPEITDPEELIIRCYRRLIDVSDPEVSYEMRVVDLEVVSGLDHEKVRLGDTVKVIDREFRPALEVEARVVEIKRHLIEPERNEIKLSNVLPMSTDDAGRLRATEEEINNKFGAFEQGALDLNLVNDHSFEVLIPRDRETQEEEDDFQLYWISPVDLKVANYGNWMWWVFGTDPYGVNWDDLSPKMITIFGTGEVVAPSIWDLQCFVVDDESIPNQMIPVHPIAPEGEYTFSGFVSSFTKTEAIGINGTARMTVEAFDDAQPYPNSLGIIATVDQKMIAEDVNEWIRIQATAETIPENTYTMAIKFEAVEENFTYLLDGIQATPLPKPAVYQPESQLWRTLKGQVGNTFTDINVNRAVNIGHNPDLEMFNTTLTQDGDIITRNNSQWSVAWNPSQTLTSGAWTKLNFVDVFVDWKNEGRTGTDDFEIFRDSIHHMTASVRLTGVPAGTTVALAIYVNGSENTRLFSQNVNAGSFMAGGSALIFTRAGDIVDVRVNVDNAGIQTVVTGLQSFFKAFRIGGRR